LTFPKITPERQKELQAMRKELESEYPPLTCGGDRFPQGLFFSVWPKQNHAEGVGRSSTLALFE